MDDSAFRHIIAPGARWAITVEAVKERVQEEAKHKRKEICLLLAKLMLFLKIDRVPT